MADSCQHGPAADVLVQDNVAYLVHDRYRTTQAVRRAVTGPPVWVALDGDVLVDPIEVVAPLVPADPSRITGPPRGGADRSDRPTGAQAAAMRDRMTRPLRTVGELREALESVDDDVLVLVAGYEGGWQELCVGQRVVQEHSGVPWWSGRFDDADGEVRSAEAQGGLPVGSPVRAVLLGRVDVRGCCSVTDRS